ncbi:MAG: FG-GAP-like repeat-containing protein [Acidobacteriota bacterium]
MIDPLSWLKLVSPLRILTLAGLLLGGLGTTAGAGEIPFAPAQTIDGGFDGAISVAAGDLDGDGIPELVGAAGLDGDISFWRNTAGDGSTWTETLVDGSFAGVKSVALANLDSRTGGSIDILAVSSDTIRIWRNTSNDGSAWMTRDVSTAATFPGPADAVPADIDGTGGLDVVGVSAAGVSWWFNRFAIGQIWDKNDIDITGGMPSSVAAADLDGDGDTDVIVTFYDGDEVAWYENTAGNGTAWTRRSVATLFDGAQSVTAADLDGDGDIDLAGAALIGNEVAWWENTLGDGTAWTQRVIDSTVDDASSVEARDMDGDGDLDLLGTASAFGEIQWFDNVAGDGSAWVTRDLPGTFFGAADAIALDVDDDGDQDVVGAALGADEIAWWENTSIHRSAAYPVGSPIASSLGNVRSVHGADVDGDVDRDLLVAIEDAGEVLWWENGAGDGSVWTEHTIDAAYAGASGVYAGDLDGDGDLDVYATSATQNNGVWWENLAGDGSSWGARFQIFSGQFRPSNPQIVDIDADGTLDVMAVMTDLFRITFWRNLDGDGTNWFQSIAQGNYREARSAHATDIDGDGDADIATAASFFNTVSFVRNGLSLGYQVNIVDDTFTDAFSTFAADLDDDGDVDILAAGRSTGEIAWWENTTGDGDFGPRITLATGFVGVTRVAAADLDGDGDNDVYGTSSTGNQLVWWENVGDGSAWTQRTVDDALSLAAPVIAADPDGDGKLDLVAAGGGGDLGWWRNLGGEFALPTADVAQPLVADGSSPAVLRIDAAHRGRAGDSAVELATVEILLESTPGTPMTDAEAGALLDRLSLYADDGSGEFESGNDTEIASQSSFTLDAGALTLTIADDQALAQVAFGAPRSFFVVPTFEVAASATMLDGFRFTHLTQSQMVGASSSGEDAANDLPLTLEFSANVSSGPIGFNAAPVAQDDAVLLLEDQVAAGNVLDGTAGGLDTDPNGTALAAILVTPPSQGVLLTGLAADGGFQYEPNGNFVGVDSFTYRADDGLASSNLATVTLTVAAVNDPPSFSITPQHLSSEDAAPQTVPAFAFGIAPGPADEGGQAVTFTITGFSDSSLFATLPAIAPDGTLTYEAAGDAVGTSTMTVRLTDDGGTANGGVDQSAEQSFDIVIQGVNDAPSFTLPLGESRTSEDGGAQSLPGFATEILAGPEDETGQTLTFSVTGNTNPALFAVPPALAPDGTLTYTSAVDGNGAATITVLLMDDGGTAGGGIDQSGPKSFDIVVEPVNDPPSFTLSSLTPSLEDGGPRNVPGFASSILPGPSDESGQGVQFLVTDNSNPDLFAVPPSLSADGTLTYASAPDANGTASVTVVLMDDGGTAGGGVDQSAEQSFDIEVTPVNDPPSFAVPSTSEVEGTPTPQTVVGFATQISAGPADESGQALQFQILGNSAPELFAAGPELTADGTPDLHPRSRRQRRVGDRRRGLDGRRRHRLRRPGYQRRLGLRAHRSRRRRAAGRFGHDADGPLGDLHRGPPVLPGARRLLQRNHGLRRRSLGARQRPQSRELPADCQRAGPGRDHVVLRTAGR